MIKAALTGLHPTFLRPVADTLRGLMEDYPVGCLSRVELYESPGDESMANASQPGVIALNKRWFGRPIDELVEASRERNVVTLQPSGIPLLWHGDMEEPYHVLAHEYGHLLQDAFPEWKAFATPHWQLACGDPANCRPVSGYSLVSADEWWGDHFAAYRLMVNNEGARLLGEHLNEWLDARNSDR